MTVFFCGMWKGFKETFSALHSESSRQHPTCRIKELFKPLGSSTLWWGRSPPSCVLMVLLGLVPLSHTLPTSEVALKLQCRVLSAESWSQTCWCHGAALL